jgi:hypothetical protein
MSQLVADEVLDALLEEVDELERGIHGYFPFSQRSSKQYQKRLPSCRSSIKRYDDLANERDVFSEDAFSEDDYTNTWMIGDLGDSDRAAIPASRRQRTSTRSFLRDALRRISNLRHPLHFLVVARRIPNGQVTYDWRRTTRNTASGSRQRGRYDYQGHETGPIVQVGHQGAFAAGVPERLMLEDAGLNQRTGQTIESKGAYSFKDAVVIGGVPVDVASAQQWERLGLLPRGTVARSPRRPAPMP